MSDPREDKDKPTVVVTFDASSKQKAVMREVLGDSALRALLKEASPEEHPHLLERAAVLLVSGFPPEIQTSISSLRHLRMIQFLSAGVDGMPLSDVPSDVLIASNAGAFAEPMAEHVLAMTLALAKNLKEQDRKLQHGEFDHGSPNRMLAGSIAGIVGFGGIGRATARLMRAFGVKIHAINTSGKSSEPVDFIGTLQDLERVLRKSDVVVITLPLTKETERLIGQEQLDWMKRDAILVNVARAGIIDEPALYTHVKARPSFLVGIDTWWGEQSFGDTFQTKYPFLDLPNVIGSPHNSANVVNTPEIGARHAVENVKRFLDGDRVVGIVRREDYV